MGSGAQWVRRNRLNTTFNKIIQKCSVLSLTHTQTCTQTHTPKASQSSSLHISITLTTHWPSPQGSLLKISASFLFQFSHSQFPLFYWRLQAVATVCFPTRLKKTLDVNTIRSAPLVHALSHLHTLGFCCGQNEARYCQRNRALGKKVNTKQVILFPFWPSLTVIENSATRRIF